MVSLAAALSIPVYLEDGTEFPQRNLILFITFIVILNTLLLQGLTLPLLIRKMKLPDFKDYIPEEEADNLIGKELATQSLQYVTENYKSQMETNPFLLQLTNKWKHKSIGNAEASTSAEIKAIYMNILEQQRLWLLAKNEKDKHFDEEVIRKHLRRIDIEEELKHL